VAGERRLFEYMNGTGFRQGGDRRCGAGGAATHDVNRHRKTQR